MKSSREMFESVQEKAREIKISKRKQAKRLAVCAIALVLAVGITVGVCVPLLSAKDGQGQSDIDSHGAFEKVAYAVSGFDGTEWDETTNKWTEVVDYDVDLSAYPDSITRYLAYQMETRDEKNKDYFCVEITFDAYMNYLKDNNGDYIYNIDPYQEISDFIDEHLPEERVEKQYNFDTRTGEYTLCKGATALLTKGEILQFAEIYQAAPITYLYGFMKQTEMTVAMRIKMAEDSNNQYFGKLSDNLYGKFGAVKDDEYLPIELTVEFPLEKYDDYSVSKQYSWNELVMFSQSARFQLKSFGIENEQLQKCLWKFNTFYDKTNETTQIYTATNGAEFEEFKISATTQKNMGMQRYITFDKNMFFVPIFDDFGEYNTEKDIEIFGSISPYQSFVDTPIEYNYTLGDVTIYQTNVEFSCSVSFNVVLSKKQIKQLCVGDLAEYVKMELKAPYYYGEGGTLECNFVPEYVAKCVDIDNLDDVVWTIPMSLDESKYYINRGTFYSLELAYEKGLISDEEIKSLAYYNNNGKEYVIGEGFKNTDYIPISKSPEKLDDKTQVKIKQTYIDYIYHLGIVGVKESDLVITDYFGTYNGFVAVKISQATSLQYVKTSGTSTIADTVFYYTDCNKPIMLWKEK